MIDKTILVDRHLREDSRLQLRLVVVYDTEVGESTVRVKWFLSNGELEAEIDPTTALAVVLHDKGRSSE